MSKVRVELDRADAELTKIALKGARTDWIQDVRAVGGKTTPTPFDDAIAAFEAALKEATDA